MMTLYSFGYSVEMINNQAIHFQIDNGEKIDFIVVDTTLSENKPVFLFCQGSLPYPLFINFEKHGIIMHGGGISNFDINSIRKYYHLVVISMPHTPMIAEERNINGSLQYVPDKSKPQEFSLDYLASDNLDNYVKRALAVLKYLSQQKWVTNEKLVVAGHSQGARIATAIVKNNSNVSHLGLFGANPFGRTEQLVRQARLDAEHKKISQQEANNKINELYKFYEIINNSDSANSNYYYKSWKSFSNPPIDDWLNFNIPIYLAYGTNDVISEMCDLVPLSFIRLNKNNLTYRRYLNQDHNFFGVNDMGTTDYNHGHWKEVMNEFVNWTISTK